MGPGEWPAAGTDRHPDPRQESRAQRDDRNLGELLQELRVAGLGVQVLFGFLLSLPFTNRFTRLSPGQPDLYLVSLVLALRPRCWSDRSPITGWSSAGASRNG
jgi:hypothetical protein